MAVGKLIRYGLPFSNVVNTGTATNNITPGKTLENLQLKLGGTSFTKAMVTLFKLKANGKTIIEASGSNLDKINAYRGTGTTNAAFLDVYFSDYALNNEFDRHVGAFDTLGVANITTEVTITGATAPVLTPILIESANQRDSKGAPAEYSGLITKILQYPFNIATGGRLPVNLPFGPQNGAIIKRVHVVTNNGTATGVTVKEDGLVVHESVKAENEFLQTRHGRVPQANFYTVDFVLDGDVRKALNTRNARSLEWLIDFSGADAGNVIVEYIDVLGNL